MASRPAVGFVLVFLALGSTRAAESPLSSGLPFPDLAGKSLTGSDLTVSMRDGLPKVVVMTFTRTGATRAQPWLDACRKFDTQAPGSKAPTPVPSPEPAPPVACYDVRISQGVPRIVRGFIEGRMKKGLAPEQLARTLVVYKDEDDWKDRLMVMSDNQDDPFIVMVNRQGRVQSLLRGAFNSATLEAEQAKLLAR